MIEIVEPNPHWVAEFQSIGTRLRQGLGEAAIRIDHIGSTAVPGLCAKDVIDVQISVTELAPRLASQVVRLGFVAPEGLWSDHRPPEANGPDTDWAKLFFMQAPGERRTNIHVRVVGRPNQRFALLFRDYLVAHPPAAAAYGRLKRHLAASIDDVEQYTVVKDPVVDLIHFAATAWAERLGWQARATDA